MLLTGLIGLIPPQEEHLPDLVTVAALSGFGEVPSKLAWTTAA